MGIDLIAGPQSAGNQHPVALFCIRLAEGASAEMCAGEKSTTSDGLLISACTTEQKIIGGQKFGGLKHPEVGGE
jgi:hypothetical protein